jgi:hypothetical protein
MCKILEQRSGSSGSRHHQGEECVDIDKSSRSQGKFLDDHQGDRRSSEGLGDLGQVTSQCWGPIGTRLKWKYG